MDFTILVNIALLATFDSLVAGTLIVKPRDTDVKVNQSAYFNCSTDHGSTAIFWLHGSDYVYTGSILDPYRERFRVDRSERNGTSISNLVIHSVQPGDAGEYICAEDEGVGEKYSIQLVVLDGDPICRSNIELDKVIGQNTCNVEPDEVELSCIVTYHGNIPPQLEWKKNGDDRMISQVLYNVSSGNNYSYILKLKGDISLDKSSYICETTRIAHEPRTCISEVINVLYALGDNSTLNGRVDDEIRCEANTTQSCNYTWRWFDNSDVTTESYSAIFKPRKPGLHKCEAECYLRNKACNLLVMQVIVMPALTSENSELIQTSTAVIPVVVVVIVVAMLVLGVILILIVRHRKNKERNAKSAAALRPKKNIGSVSAWSFFYGYLRLVLTDFKERLIEETLSDYPDLVPKTVLKMLIIIPESCFCAASLVVPNKIEFTGMFVKNVSSRAGNQERDYKSSLFKLIDQEKNEEYYFVGEFATPLLTMYETCISALGGMTKYELYDERDAFYCALQDILTHRNHTEYNGQIKLLYWSDPVTKKPDQLDIYNFLLLELRKEIKLQQNATGENVSPITGEDESTPLNKHPENRRQSGRKVKLKKNIGSASAWSYFYGYLRFVLPDFKQRLIEETLIGCPGLVPKTIQKMLIIMPESCICAKSLEVPEKIELTGMFVRRVVSRAGNPEHEYKSSLLKLIDKEENEEYYFVGQLATSLLTMYETCLSDLGGMTKNQLYNERDAFQSTLRAILSHRDNADCNQFKLLNWSDLEAKKGNQLDIYNFLLIELRKEIKLQQQNENNIGTVRTDNNVPHSSNTIEMSEIIA